MATEKFEELVRNTIKRGDPTNKYIYNLYIIALSVVKELTNNDSLFINNIYNEMIIPSPEICSHSMEIYAKMIFSIAIWSVTSNNGIGEDRYIWNMINDLLYRIRQYEYLRDNYSRLNFAEINEYESLRTDLMRLMGPSITSLLHDQAGNIRLNQ